MRDISLGMKCISFMIVVANIIFLLLSILLIIVGALVLTVFKDFEAFLEGQHFSPAILLISIGVFILLISFFGCCGALRRSTLMINVHATFLILILILEIGLAITAFVIRCDFYSTIEKNLNDFMKEYNTEIYAKDAWDFAQKEMHCCGIHKPLDWAAIHVRDGHSIFMDGQTFTIPYTCCEDPQECKFNIIYMRGCLDEINDGISHYASSIGYGAIGLASIQLVGIIFSCMLAKSIRRTKTLDAIENQRIRNMRHATTIRTNAPTDVSSA